MTWIVLCLIVIALAFLFYASYSIRLGFYLKAVCKISAFGGKTVALTYDDGPDDLSTLPLLNVLLKHNVKACFFCIGKKAEQFPEVVRKMIIDGHIVGNHSYIHATCFPLYGKRRMTDDLLKTQRILEDISGCNISLFRPPYGVTNPTIASAVATLGLKTIGWSLRSFDTQCKTADEVLERIKRKLKPQDIILLHDRMPFAAELTDKLLIYLKENGYTVKELEINDF